MFPQLLDIRSTGKGLRSFSGTFPHRPGSPASVAGQLSPRNARRRRRLCPSPRPCDPTEMRSALFLCALRTPFCPSQRTAPARTRLGDRRARGETALSSLSSLEPTKRAVWVVPVAAAPPETLPGRTRRASAPADDAAGETGPRDSTQTVLETNPHQLPSPLTKGSTEPESLALPKRPRREHGTTANARSRQPT